jgi:hypothetical protein
LLVVPDSSARLHGRDLVSAVGQGVPSSSVRQRMIRQRVADSVCRRVVSPVPMPSASVRLHGRRVGLGVAVAAVKPGWPTERRRKRKWIRLDLELVGDFGEDGQVYFFFIRTR